MKIAVTSSGHIPSQHAHSINVVKHANALVKLGYNVELLSVKRFYENKFILEYTGKTVRPLKSLTH